MADKLKRLGEEIPRLRRYARFLVRDVDQADDLVQECLTRGIAKIDSWSEGTNLRAWLFVILKNCHINQLRQNRRIAVDGEIGVEHEGPAVAPSQDAHMALREVRDAFLTLSEEHREILLLVAIEGLQYEEAAAVLGVALGTVRSRLSRARQALRDALGEGGLPPPERGRPWPGSRGLADRDNGTIQGFGDDRLKERNRAGGRRSARAPRGGGGNRDGPPADEALKALAITSTSPIGTRRSSAKRIYSVDEGQGASGQAAFVSSWMKRSLATTGGVITNGYRSGWPMLRLRLLTA